MKKNFKVFMSVTFAYFFVFNSPYVIASEISIDNKVVPQTIVVRSEKISDNVDSFDKKIIVQKNLTDNSVHNNNIPQTIVARSEKISVNEELNVKKIIDVPYINQDNIASGCEAISATMLLKFYGYQLSETNFTDNFLIRKNWSRVNGKNYGPDPNSAYPGDPYLARGLNCGFGCYAPSLAKSINLVLDEKIHKANVLSNVELDDIVKNYICNDIPVLIWATMDMNPSKPSMSWTINYVDENSSYKIGDTFTWIAGEHCLVLVGYDNDNYYFNDPYKNHGIISYNKELVKSRYNELGNQAVVIENVQKNTQILS